MIYVTGDLHGETSKLDYFFETKGKDLTRDDYVIILGDFGMIWSADTRHGYPWDEKRIQEYFEEKYRWTTLFVDGNHENFVHLKQFPVKEWNGGKAGILSEHCLWLRRGEIFMIDGSTFLTIGGAYSIDKNWRHPQITWWPDEAITREDIRKTKLNLAAHKNKVDYILTHCAPYPIYFQIALQERFVMENKPASENEMVLQEINEITTFKKWYFGHYHINNEFENGKYVCLYQDIRKI